MELFEFRQHFRIGQSSRVVCIASLDALGRVLAENDLAALFGGWIKYRGQTDGMKYLGVWGARNTRTMRRILREKGVEVVVHHIRPAGIEMHSRRSQSIRPVKRHSVQDSDVSRCTNDEDGLLTSGGPSVVRSSAGRRRTGSNNMVIRRSKGCPSRGQIPQGDRHREAEPFARQQVVVPVGVAGLHS